MRGARRASRGWSVHAGSWRRGLARPPPLAPLDAYKYPIGTVGLTMDRMQTAPPSPRRLLPPSSVSSVSRDIPRPGSPTALAHRMRSRACAVGTNTDSSTGMQSWSRTRARCSSRAVSLPLTRVSPTALPVPTPTRASLPVRALLPTCYQSLSRRCFRSAAIAPIGRCHRLTPLPSTHSLAW